MRSHSICIFLTYFNIMLQGSSMLSQMAGLPSFLWLKYIYSSRFLFFFSLLIISCFLYSFSIIGCLGYFHVLTIINNAAMNIGVQIYLWDNISNFISFRYILRSGFPASYGSPIFNFLRNLHTVFCNGWANLHSHQQYTGVPFSPAPVNSFR